MPYVLLTKAQPANGAAGHRVQVAGYVTRKGTVVSPYQAGRRAAVAAPKVTEQQRVDLEDYKAGGYRDLNRYLRDPGSVRASLAPHLERQARSLDRALAKSPAPHPVTVYRGMQHASLARHAEQLLGRELPLSSFWSTSRSEKEVRQYAGFGAGAVVMHIRVPAGAHAMDMEPYASGASVGEEELLLSRHGRLRIVAVDRQGTMPVITAEYLRDQAVRP